MNKLNTTIILSLILMLSGCAANTDEAPSATTAATTTTAAATTHATTTSAQTTAVTEQSEPVETTAVTTTTTATTTEIEPDQNEQTEQAEPVKPEENTTPDGQYTLADSDLVNPDGTYTQTEFNPDTIPAWSSDSVDDGFQDYMKSANRTSNPSKIPYSEITLENAHEAFPFLGWLGYTPDYTMVLPTDSPDVIASKVYDNLIGKEPTSGHDLWKYYNFTSEAEYNVYLAEQQAAADAAEAKGQQAQAANDRGDAIGGNGSEEYYEALGDKYAEKFGVTS